jgi:hypothetical protein
MRGEPHRLARSCAIDPFHLEQDPSHSHWRNPSFRGAFAFAHAGFSRLFGKRLIRKHANSYTAAALDMAGERDTGSFEGASVDSRSLYALQTEIAKGQLKPA